MKEKVPQKQKHAKGMKVAYIWEELDRKYGILETGIEVAV